MLMKATTPSDSQIEELADALTAKADGIHHAIDAGYTYLGQFIAHDIIAARSSGRVVRPYLQLDSLYGGDETYASLQAGLFRIGPSTPGGPDDLPRRAGAACIPEGRNDDNVVIAQFHLLWQRIHNFTLTSGSAATFSEARQLTTGLFQLVVVEDYLRQMLHPDVYCAYFHHGERWLNYDPAAIAPEFSHAAFRFGHSMVRAKYRSFPNNIPDVPVEQLFRADQPLASEHQLDWTGFFGWPGKLGHEQSSLEINTRITPAMRSVRAVGGGGQTVDVVLANLQAGRKVGLAPGKEYALRYGVTPLDNLGAFAECLRPATTITIDNLPLWPYVLLEAEQQMRGRRLGVLGSVICAETLANAIAGAHHSIYKDGPERLEDVLRSMGSLGHRISSVGKGCGPVRRGERTFSMRHLIALVDTPA